MCSILCYTWVPELSYAATDQQLAAIADDKCTAAGQHGACPNHGSKAIRHQETSCTLAHVLILSTRCSSPNELLGNTQHHSPALCLHMRSDQHQPPSLPSNPLLNPSESKGLFTSTNPETRRVKPDAQGRVTVKVVYVVLEAQYQSALTTAVKRINSTNKQVRVRSHRLASGKRRATQADHRRVVDNMLAHPPWIAHATRLLGLSCARGQRSSSQQMSHSCCCPCQVCFEIVGYLLEELRDETNFENFKNDVASAHVFIGSLIFIEELADKVRRGLVT